MPQGKCGRTPISRFLTLAASIFRKGLVTAPDIKNGALRPVTDFQPGLGDAIPVRKNALAFRTQAVHPAGVRFALRRFESIPPSPPRSKPEIFFRDMLCFGALVSEIVGDFVDAVWPFACCNPELDEPKPRTQVREAWIVTQFRHAGLKQ